MGTEAMWRSQNVDESGDLLLLFFSVSVPPRFGLTGKDFVILAADGQARHQPDPQHPIKTYLGFGVGGDDCFLTQNMDTLVQIVWHCMAQDTANMTVCNQWLGWPKFPGSLFDHPSQERCRQDLEGAYLISFEYHLIRPASSPGGEHALRMLWASSRHCQLRLEA